MAGDEGYRTNPFQCHDIVALSLYDCGQDDIIVLQNYSVPCDLGQSTRPQACFQLSAFP